MERVNTKSFLCAHAKLGVHQEGSEGWSALLSSLTYLQYLIHSQAYGGVQSIKTNQQTRSEQRCNLRLSLHH